MDLHKLRIKLRGALTDTAQEISDAKIFLTASSLAYTTILSIIPLLALSFVVFKAFGGLEKVYDAIAPFILENLAEGTSDDVMQRLHGFIDNVHGGTVGVGGFLGLIFTSMSMLMSIENAFNHIWQVKNTRGWFQRVSSYWLFITLGPLALSIALGAVTSSHIAVHLPGVGIEALVTFALFIAYQVIPNTKVNWKFSLVAALCAGGLWEVTRRGYVLYVDKFAAYNRIYGSLAAIPIVLFWIYVLWVLILSGAALSAALQRRFQPKQ